LGSSLQILSFAQPIKNTSKVNMKIKQLNIWFYIFIASLLISGCKSIQITPSISAGIAHTCFLNSEGVVKCWGNNKYGQLGDGTTINRFTPTQVVGLTDKVVAISAGGYHTCALTTDGKVKCWGGNDANGGGRLGDGTTTQQSRPVNVIGLPDKIKAIAAGGYHTCAITSQGSVKCWGDNQAGALGNGKYKYGGQLTPVDVIGLTNGIISLSAADGRTCAVTEAGKAKCWGDGFFGELGNGTTNWSLTPVDVKGLTNVKAITGGDYHTCALTSGGGVKCWGSSTFGSLGNSEPSKASLLDFQWLTSGIYPIPVDVSGLTSGIKSIAAGGRHTCALTINGGVKCWGCNENGQLGDGKFIAMPPFANSTPVDVIGLTSGVIAITAGDSHTCALTQDGKIKCWGSNSAGELGNGTTTNQLTPVDVVMQ
jgi:alpha-tubulin suppressor-like RCC1 family protein